jgi:hypothetical protein
VAPQSDWKTYRTRYLVKAIQLDHAADVVDALGREQHGEPGDYIVESSDGSRRVARRDIFEDLYVELDEPRQTSPPSTSSADPQYSSVFGIAGAIGNKYNI